MSVNTKMTAIAEAIRGKTGKTAALTLDQMVTEIEGITGGTEMFAAIGVTYPAGSTLTCTNGSKTLTAKNTSGQWVFAIPEAGTWTVTAMDGTNTKSQSVEINSEGQFENVELSYRTYLVKNKTPLITFVNAGSVTAPTITSSSITFGAQESAVRSGNKIDCTGRTKVVAEINVITQSYIYPINVVVTDNTSNGDAYIPGNPNAAPTNALAYGQKKPATENSLNTITVDISSVTGSHYIGVGAGYCPNATIENLYIE